MGELGKSEAVVPKLISELYDKGYHVYMDNRYTRIKLFQYSEINGTAACGTARKDRIMLPRSLLNESLKRREGAFRRSGNVMMLWYWDKKEVYFLSTIHQTEFAQTAKKNKRGEDIIKPVLVNHYNRFMGGIDRNDAMIGNYSSIRKSMKWTIKVAFHFIEEAVLNSFALFDKLIRKKRFPQFKLLLIRQMLGEVTMQ